jgi:hypothetical protein
MKISRSLAILLFLSVSAFSQEIPAGVRYKKAADDLNNLAKKNLESALLSDAVPSDLFNGVTVLGPMLWKSLKPANDPVMLAMKPVTLIVPGPSSFAAEGKRVLFDVEREAFWNVFRKQYPNLKEGKVRKGNAQEISFYWATIPFDIEEPLWVIEAGSDRFIAHFQVKEGQPRLFWIDLVGDLATLKP